MGAQSYRSWFDALVWESKPRTVFTTKARFAKITEGHASQGKLHLFEDCSYLHKDRLLGWVRSLEVFVQEPATRKYMTAPSYCTFDRQVTAGDVCVPCFRRSGGYVGLILA